MSGNKEEITRIVKEKLKEHGITLKNIEDLLDFDAIIDSELSIEENVERVLSEIKVVLSKKEYEEMLAKEYESGWTVFKKQIKSVESEKRKLRKIVEKQKEQIIELQKELSKLKEQLRMKTVKKSDIKVNVEENVYNQIEDHIEILLSSEVVNGLMIVGTAGIGKSYAIEKILKERGVNAVYIRNRLSARGFFEKLKSGREDVVYVLDDIMKFDEDLIGMLLSAVDTKRVRKITWITKDTSEDVDTVWFKGKIVIIANDIQFKDEISRAFMDRCLVLKLNYRHDFFLKKLEEIDIPQQVKEYIQSRKVVLSYRILQKLESVAKSNLNEEEKVRYMLKQIIHQNRDDSLLLSLIEQYNIETACRLYMRETGKSRRTFFYRYAKLKEFGVVDQLCMGKCKVSAKVVQSKCKVSANQVQNIVQNKCNAQKQKNSVGNSAENGGFSKESSEKKGIVSDRSSNTKGDSNGRGI